MGDLNCELHAEYVPRTVENFVKLCQTGYYDGTIFHRNIRSFIIQVLFSEFHFAKRKSREVIRLVPDSAVNRYGVENSRMNSKRAI